MRGLLSICLLVALWADPLRSGCWDPSTGVLHPNAHTRVYEVLQGILDPVAQACCTHDAKGRAQFHFVLNNCVAKDNRTPAPALLGSDRAVVEPTSKRRPARQEAGNGTRSGASVLPPLPSLPGRAAPRPAASPYPSAS